MILIQPLEGLERGLEMAPRAGPGIDDRGQADVLVEDDDVARGEAALGPGLEGLGRLRLRHGLQGALQDAPVAAERVGLQHRVQVAQAAYVAKSARGPPIVTG